MKEYYSLKKIKSKKCKYNIIVGQRSNGKSYAFKEECIDNFLRNGKQSAVIRREMEDFRMNRANTYFDDIVQNGTLAKKTHGKYDAIIYQSRQWFIGKRDEKGDIANKVCFCHAFALTQMEHDKSNSYPNVSVIGFEEFISRRGYLPDEFIIFCNVLSTIIRDRTDVTIYMLANTVNQYGCPYFEEMGITHIRQQRQGSIDVYEYGDSGLSVAVEYCSEMKAESKETNSYFCFDNSRLKMITSGVWELAIYPHAPYGIERRDIIFSFFVKYCGELVQGDVVKHEHDVFIFFHKKTTPLKFEDKDLIYDLEYSPKRNYARFINQPVNKAQKTIYDLVRQDKVFYQSNDVGEILRNYFIECKKRE